MNAIKLADEIDGFLKEEEQLPWGTKQVYLDQAATMLRQQQAEIEALKYEKSSGVYDVEPVAWIANDAKLPLSEDGNYWLYSTEIVKGNSNYIPLYTHPAKTLTDEEILSKFMIAWKDFLMVEQGTNGVMNIQMVALHFYKLGMNCESN